LLGLTPVGRKLAIVSVKDAEAMEKLLMINVPSLEMKGNTQIYGKSLQSLRTLRNDVTLERERNNLKTKK